MLRRSPSNKRSTVVQFTLLAFLYLNPPAASSDLHARPHAVDFLYIESNTDGSSGGHVALRIDDDVFHFQHESGFNHLTRNGWSDFLRTYSDIENRDIHSARLDISAPDSERLADRLNLARLIQEAHLDHLVALEEEAQFFGLPTQEQRERLEKTFLFAPGQPPDEDMIDLTFRLNQDHISTLSLKDHQESKTPPHPGISPSQSSRPPTQLDIEHYPVYPKTSLQSIRANSLFLHLENTLRKGWPIRANAVIDASQMTSNKTARLSPQQMIWMRELREEIYQFIAKGIQNPKLFPPKALEVAIGRYLLIGKSLRTGSLFVLDLSETDSDKAIKGLIASHPNQALSLQLKENTLRRIKVAMLSSESKELALRQLEEKLTEIAQLQRYAASSLSPQKAKPGRILNQSLKLPETSSIERQQQAEENEEAFRDAFMKAYRYNLITHNCATELMRELDAIKPFKQPNSASSHPDSFVPFRLYEHIHNDQPSLERQTIPSLHHRLTASLEEKDPLIRLEELSTLTSTSYTPRSEDGAFLLFTDQSPFFLRPVLGSGNLGYSLLTGAIGLLKLPVDNGSAVLEGLYGALFSLPELVGWNIRKGSYSGDDPRISLPYH